MYAQNATTIAVLPFINRSPEPENEFFSDGITEEIINALAHIENLKVTSRTSSFYFKGKEIPLKEIAQKLGVMVILEGSVRIAGDTVRISAQLIQAADDFHFWSETWDRQLKNIFEIQDEISLLIAEKLREQFGHFEIEEHLVSRQTDSLDAYAYSLKANYYFNKWNPTDVQKAIELYDKAVTLDPRHTESYVGLADAYGFMATTEFMPRGEAWQKAAAYTQRAFELNPENAGVHYQLANLAFFVNCDFKESARHARKAIELKPNYPEAQQYMAYLYMLNGEMERALHHLKLALAIDPLNKETQFYQAYYFYRSHDFEKAARVLQELLADNPKNIPALIVYMYALLMQEKYDEVLSTLDHIPEDIVIPNEKLGVTCLAYIQNGDDKQADELLAQLQQEAENPISFQAHSYLFLAFANLGRHDEAFAWLEKALAMKSSIFLLSYSDPLINGLTDDPRYPEFHKKLYPPIEEDQDERKTALLDHETAEAFTQRLLEFVDNENPFLNPGLSLRSLAEQVEIHPNQLSWLLNEQLGKNFNEFINHFRVEYFKQLAKDPANAHISLIGLAYESGFNSKTVFNTFFKKETGMTPSAYLKQAS